MSLVPEWPHADSPFHEGELSVQARAGSRDLMAQIGRRAIRPAMPPQHREFFPLLPFVVLGAVDDTGQPWATLLADARRGFVTVPDETHLEIRGALSADDPLRPLVREGASVGLLGIDLSTRRRNRANGRVTRSGPDGFTLHVLQSFGNCPKYIQRRELQMDTDERRPAGGVERIVRATRLEGRAAALVRGADTFFIATHAPGEAQNAGADVSHRGGPAGFVSLNDDGRSLTWPDYVGNGLFNTLGNLAVEPRAGLLFIDFDRGDLLHVNGRAQTVWDGPEMAATPGAKRLVRLQVEQVLLREAAWPLRWRFIEASPALPA